jgi:hypothetical protein
MPQIYAKTKAKTNLKTTDTIKQNRRKPRISRLQNFSKLFELFESKNDGNLNPYQFKQASEMLKHQNKLFDVRDKDTVVLNVRHEIETGNSRPVHCPPKRKGFKERDYIKQQVTEMKARDVFQESNSPWSRGKCWLRKGWQIAVLRGLPRVE